MSLLSGLVPGWGMVKGMALTMRRFFAPKATPEPVLTKLRETVRAAVNELFDFGRPARVRLAVLVDRGGRELPIHADIIGKKIDVGDDERVDVLVEELDGRDAVVVIPRGEQA